jgi:cardiolipin synthase
MKPKGVFFTILQIFFLCFWCAACHPLKAQHIVQSYPYHGKPPFIVSENGPLSRTESARLFAGLLPEADSTPLLGLHTAFVQDMTGSAIFAGNDIELLHDGPATFDRMAEAIDHAQDHINIETFIFRDDKIGHLFSDMLIKKSSEGVAVNLMYDGFGNRKTPAVFYEKMRASGVKTLEFNPFAPIEAALSDNNLNNRDHRKILVVDGKVAFTGGINFYWENSTRTDAYGNRSLRPWRDTHIRIEGPAVTEFQRIFFETWNAKNGPKLASANYFPIQDSKGDLLVQIIADGPEREISNIYMTYVSAIINARNSIHLTQSYLAPPEEMLTLLEKAASSGVDVKIIAPSFSDFWLPFYAGRYNYTRLLRSGIRIFEFQNAMLHSKLGIFDGTWSIIGSANLIPRSFVHDLEVETAVLGSTFASQMEANFIDDLSESKEVKLEDWKNRPFKDKFLESFAQLFRFLL